MTEQQIRMWFETRAAKIDRVSWDQDDVIVFSLEEIVRRADLAKRLGYDNLAGEMYEYCDDKIEEAAEWM
jgi:hypothetical protein